MINDKTNVVIEELSQLLLSRYQFGLETSIEGSDFVFDSVHLFYCKCHKIHSNLNRHRFISLDCINDKVTLSSSIKKLINNFNAK